MWGIQLLAAASQHNNGELEAHNGWSCNVCQTSGDDDLVVLCGGTEQCGSNERLNVGDDGVAGETNGSTGEVSGELSVALSKRLLMASPAAGGGKHVHNLPYSSDINQFRAWLYSFAIKQDKNVAPMSTCQAAFERGATDIDV
ncbi:putative cellulose synthase A catalytic subunit 3 [Sesbania bispinosa]|nr:putative cellulose synthase A catalytic subunit 3 [Sesbania bispinosa]